MSKIRFNSHGYGLAGNLFLASKPGKIAFLMIQGWAGHQSIHEATALADLGFTSMTYDMRGNGGSEGNLDNFSRDDFLNDTMVAYDYLKQQVPQSTAIGVIGSSFGAYTAMLLSELRPVVCMSLRVPANYPDEDFDEPQVAQMAHTNNWGEWRQQKVTYTENRALTALHNFTGKLQIIVAGADEQVPRQVTDNYAEAVSDRRQLDYAIMEGAPHNLVNEQLAREYKKLLVTWAKTV